MVARAPFARLDGRKLRKGALNLTFPGQRVEMVVMAHQTRSRPLGLTTSQAAQALGVSLGTVRRWSDMGHIRAYRTPGGQRRFSEDQIEAFLRSLEPAGDEPVGRAE